MGQTDEELQRVEDERRIDGDRLIRIPRWALDDILGLLRLSEVASMDRRIATKIADEIGRRVAADEHPSGS
jgi:hypothetical protein